MNKTYLFIIIISFCIIAPFMQLKAACPPGGGASPDGEVCINNPLGEGKTNINIIIGQIINAVLGVVGSLALLMFIYGGFTWMLAAGNNERVQKGKNILVWATVGLVVIFSAYAIVLFVFQGLGVPET